MSEKKPRPKSDQAPDLFEIIRQQHGNVQYMRFYLQQEYFTCYPLVINQQQGILLEDTKNPLVLKLFINRIILNTVSDVLIMNKFVYNNSKIMNTTMESGREMILGKYVKKHINWQGFLNKKQFIMIKKAYDSLTVQDQLRIQYSVLSISNLILKLGINISKLSCILLQRKYTSAFLSVPTLSVVFLQYLMYKFFQSKQIQAQDQQAKSQFIRQLPRVTYIKLSQVINKVELMTLEIGEQVFFTSQTLKRVKNLQYLQFYEHQQRDGIKNYQNITNYQYIKAINLRESLGIQSPFGFQLLFLFRTIYFNVIKDFNPDVILFVEDYDSKHRIVEPQIRALIINQLMENVTGKVFVLRQVGYRANFQYITSTNSLGLLSYQKNKQKKPTQGQVLQVYGSQMQQEESNEQQMSQSVQKMPKSVNENIQSPHKKQQRTFLTTEQITQIIMKRIQTLNMMTPQIQKKLDEEQILMMKKGEMEYNLCVKQGVNKGEFCEMQNILREDLSYISLALIQQSSFQQISTRSHRHMYSEQFLKKVVTSIYQSILDLKQSFQRKSQLISKLQLSKQQVTSMIQNIKLPFFIMYQDYYESIYDVRQGKSYFLDVMGEENQIVQRYRYYDNDYVKVYYGQQNQLLVFIFKTETITLFKMIRFFNPIMNQEFYYWQPVIYEQNWPFQSTDCTFIVTSQNIYKAFGQNYTSPNSQQEEPIKKQSPKISRANYRQLITNSVNSRNKVSLKAKNPKMILYEHNMDLEPHFPPILKFQDISQCRLQKGNTKVEINLMQKTLGWGFYDQLSRNVILMGGYSPQCGGQCFVNKYLHILNEKDTLIHQTGKTTNEIFMGYKHYKSKIPLFPFIYGIPFVLNKSCFILSTNGYFENLTNNNKIFLTEFKMSHQILDNKYGIISQRKLFVEYEKDEQRLLVITAKDFLVHFIVNSYGYMNCHENKCKLQSIDDGMLEIEMKVGVLIGGKPTVAILLRTDRKQQHGFEEITLYFNPIDTS